MDKAAEQTAVETDKTQQIQVAMQPTPDATSGTKQEDNWFLLPDPIKHFTAEETDSLVLEDGDVVGA